MTAALGIIASAAGGLVAVLVLIGWLAKRALDAADGRRVAEVAATETGANLRIADLNVENYKRLAAVNASKASAWRDIADERLRNPVVGATGPAGGLAELSSALDFATALEPDPGADRVAAVVPGGGGPATTPGDSGT